MRRPSLLLAASRCVLLRSPVLTWSIGDELYSPVSVQLFILEHMAVKHTALKLELDVRFPTQYWCYAELQHIYTSN